jgi:transcriptional regulator with XRE-family HTH domain
MAKPTKTPESPPLTAQVLISWRERMGYSVRDSCNALGCSRNAWARWENGGKIPRYIGLACAALALGMKPYGAQQTDFSNRDE